MRVHLSVRDLATILAALRYWQQDLADNEAAPLDDPAPVDAD